jgi:hypothetical protein
MSPELKDEAASCAKHVRVCNVNVQSGLDPLA